jgi:hypothetical protein
VFEVDIAVGEMFWIVGTAGGGSSRSRGSSGHIINSFIECIDCWETGWCGRRLSAWKFPGSSFYI